MMRICLYQPDIAQNAATILRTAACFGLPVHIIEPCGFIFSESKFRRAGMDYLDHVEIHRHENWAHFQQNVPGRRILLTTKGATSLWGFQFRGDDILLFGSEGRGVPPEIHDAADARLLIPMQNGMRSLNVAVSCGIVLGAAMGSY